MKKNYEKLIQERLDKEFNIILKVAVIVAFLAAVMLYFSPISKVYAMVNFIAAFFMLIFLFFLKKIHTSYKIILLTVITGTIAIISFIGGGFTSSFLTLLILANVLSVLFLERGKALLLSTIYVIAMFALAYYSISTDVLRTKEGAYLTWGLQIISYILFLVILYKSVYTIKNYLFENIEKLENSFDEINQFAFYDQLTGLPNVNKFELEVKKNIDKNKQDGYIVFLNLKSLSMINSTLGYETGDQALKDVKDVFVEVKNRGEVIARTGGNEFAVWIDGITEEELHNRCAYVMKELINQSIVRQKKIEFFSAYAKYSYGKDTFETCYQKAMLTLTYAKSNAIFDFLAYNDEIEKSVKRKESLKDLIEGAMKKEEFTLYYQAKIDSRTNQVVGVEGLARWNSEELGMISPFEFIPLVESINRSKEFGNFVINRACRDYKKLQLKYNEDIKVSINISPSHIKDPAIVTSIKEAIEKYQIPPNRLVVEITENILIEGLEELMPILRELKELKVQISLDDFGTGYSSLNYLGQLELDELKIDKVFIDRLQTNNRTYVLLDHIIQLSEKFDLAIIAEGVETKKQSEVLSELGCYIIQGFYYAKPESL